MSDNDGVRSQEVHPTGTEGVPAATSIANSLGDASGSITSVPEPATPTVSVAHPNINAEDGISLVIDPALLNLQPEPHPRAAAAHATVAPENLIPEEIEALLGDDIDFDPADFDPDTLANLAALSRIANEEDDGDAEQDEDQPEPSRQGKHQESGEGDENAAGPSTSRQLKVKRKKEVKQPKVKSGSVPADRGSEDDTGEGGSDDEDDDLRDVRDDSEGDQEDEKQGDAAYTGRKKKRKRNRTVLSCTARKNVIAESVSLANWLECYIRKTKETEHCDRNIPCNRCIRRGIPGMCRMEAPILPERKKRRPLEENPINYELAARVQALETLIRSGTTMDPDAANSAALEAILQATKAADKGNVDAGNALAQISSAAVGDMSELETSERAGLLMEVLQQLSAANIAKTGEDSASRANSEDPWSSIAGARSNPLPPPATPGPAAVASPSAEAEDANSRLDLTAHGFREDGGRIFIPPTLRYAERNRQVSLLDRDALPIEGDEQFLSEATKLAYGGENAVWRKGLISAVQTHTITAALRIAATFLARSATAAVSSSASGSKLVYVPSPTSGQDEAALRDSGLEIRRFRFMDPQTGAVEWEATREDLQAAPVKSIVLLYISGTMPTGVEYNAAQWRLLTTILLERQLVPLCVLAFQGLASGDVNRDAMPVRFMVHEGLPVVLVQSFDAAMGVYAESPAIVSVPTQSLATRHKVDLQLRGAARGFHSYPTRGGALLVHAVLSSPKLFTAWLNEVKAMSDRLKSVREKLYDVLANKLKTPGSWFHIKRSSGMYATALLPLNQVNNLAATRNIHIFPDGTFSLGALNAKRIDVLARGIDAVVRQSIKEQEEAQARAIAAELALQAAREQAAKAEAEAAERAAREAEERARQEDMVLMEASIADAIEQQRREEEDEKRREEERKEMDEAIRKAAERAEMQRRAEEILASIGAV